MLLANSSGAIGCDEHRRHWFCRIAARSVLYNFCAPQIINSVRLLFALLILSMIANSTSALEASEDVRSFEESFEGRKGAALGVGKQLHSSICNTVMQQIKIGVFFFEHVNDRYNRRVIHWFTAKM